MAQRVGDPTPAVSAVTLIAPRGLDAVTEALLCCSRWIRWISSYHIGSVLKLHCNRDICNCGQRPTLSELMI